MSCEASTKKIVFQVNQSQRLNDRQHITWLIKYLVYTPVFHAVGTYKPMRNHEIDVSSG